MNFYDTHLSKSPKTVQQLLTSDNVIQNELKFACLWPSELVIIVSYQRS